MIFQPVLHPLLLALLCVPLAAIGVVALVRSARKPGASSESHPALWAMRLAMVFACFLLLLRPAVPGGSSQTLATDTDIVLVVDTTASIVAEDWDENLPRLDGVRADIQVIASEYPGARFALITADASATLRMPLTTDATALISSMEVLQPEVTSRSRGSSIAVGNALLTDTLRSAAEASPERSRMVFYFGDGEQTASSAPESFASSAAYTDAGAVFGYGTVAGGAMRITSGDVNEGESGYIEYQGAVAKSVIDEANLKSIAQQLGVDYQHRTAQAPITLPQAPTTTTTTTFTESGTVGTPIELYWIAALVVLLLLGVELARASGLIVRLRQLRRPRNAEPVPPTHPAPGERTGS